MEHMYLLHPLSFWGAKGMPFNSFGATGGASSSNSIDYNTDDCSQIKITGTTSQISGYLHPSLLFLLTACIFLKSREPRTVIL